MGMTNSRARTLGKKDLRTVFRSIKFKDGLTERKEETVDEFVYYYNKARDGEVGNYVVYETINSDPNTRADDAVFIREFFAQIDVFSVNSFESKKLCEVLEKLESALTAKGFEVTMDAELYESDTRLYHAVFFVSKLYTIIGGQ
jgi:hypothetical protein